MQYKRTESFLLVIFGTLTCIISCPSQVSASLNCDTSRTFIKRECNSTYFSNLCYTFLSPYACKIRMNRPWLCEAALDATKNTNGNILKMLVKLSKEDSVKANKSEGAIISGCVNDIIHVMDNINIASSYLKNRFVSKTTILRAIKQQVVAYTGYAIEDDKRCLERLHKGHVGDYLKKMIYAAISPSLKLKAVTLTIVSRL